MQVAISAIINDGAADDEGDALVVFDDVGEKICEGELKSYAHWLGISSLPRDFHHYLRTVGNGTPGPRSGIVPVWQEHDNGFFGCNTPERLSRASLQSPCIPGNNLHYEDLRSGINAHDGSIGIFYGEFTDCFLVVTGEARGQIYEGEGGFPYMCRGHFRDVLESWARTVCGEMA